MTQLLKVANHLDLIKVDPSVDPGAKEKAREFATMAFAGDALEVRRARCLHADSVL